MKHTETISVKLNEAHWALHQVQFALNKELGEATGAEREHLERSLKALKTANAYLTKVGSWHNSAVIARGK